MHLLSTKTWLFLFCTKLVGQSNSFGIYECAEFRGSPVIVGLVDLVLSSIVSLWVFCGTKIFSRGYFVDEIFFVVEISWVQNIYRGYLVGPKLFLVGISRTHIFFSWVFRRCKIFSVDISRVQNFSRGNFLGPKYLSWVSRRSKIVSRGYFMVQKFFLVGTLWVQNFFSWVFHRSKFFFIVINFVIQRFSVAGWMRKS